MDWEGREALAHLEANDAYFGAEDGDADRRPIESEDIDTEPMFKNQKEQAGFDDGVEGIHLADQGFDYEHGWTRGNAVRRLRGEG